MKSFLNFSSSLKGTVNLYPKRTSDLLKKSSVKTLGWEERPVRVANAITWFLEHAKIEGLTPREDGYVRVQELLKHPTFLNLDFSIIEKAARSFRYPYIRLSFAPHDNQLQQPHTSEIGCWWIGLQRRHRFAKRTWKDYVDRRMIDPTKASGMVYKIPSQDWPEISNRGIPRGQSSQVVFDNKLMIPYHYVGDHVFIRVHSEKVHATHPIYNTRTTNRKAGNKTQDTFSVPAPKISPTLFEAVMRVAIERYPLILRGPTIKKAQRDPNKRIADSNISYVMNSGVDALRTYGFADVVEQSGLDVILKEQQRKLSQLRTQEEGEQPQCEG